MAKTRGSTYTTKVNLTDQGKQGSSKTMASTPLFVKEPQPGPRGDGLGGANEPQIPSLPDSHPNKSLEKTSKGYL